MTDVSATDEAVEEEDAESGGRRKRRFSGKKVFLFLILPAVLAIGVAGIFGLSMFTEEKSGEQAVQEEAHTNPSEAFYYDLPDLLVNLNTQGKQPRYLKLLVSLEVHDEETLLKMEKLLPRIIDRFQVYLRELRLEDLKGSAGLLRLKEELLIRVQRAAGVIKVNDVLFKEMLVQ